jgi:NMD protein affecting ribosome stability and mRNA decay
MYTAQVSVCYQTNTKHINTVWVERTVVKIFNLLVHPITSRLYKVNLLKPSVFFLHTTRLNIQKFYMVLALR